MRSLHNQMPTAGMTEKEYETALVHLTDQIGADLVAFCPEGEAYKLASDALAQTFGTTEDQTVWEWVKAACRKAGASHHNVIGL